MSQKYKGGGGGQPMCYETIFALFRTIASQFELFLERKKVLQII